jgi:hypothetical protein
MYRGDEGGRERELAGYLGLLPTFPLEIVAEYQLMPFKCPRRR